MSVSHIPLPGINTPHVTAVFFPEFSWLCTSFHLVVPCHSQHPPPHMLPPALCYWAGSADHTVRLWQVDTQEEHSYSGALLRLLGT